MSRPINRRLIRARGRIRGGERIRARCNLCSTLKNLSSGRPREKERRSELGATLSHCPPLTVALSIVPRSSSYCSALLSLVVSLIPHLFLQFSREEKENNEMGRATKVKRREKKEERGKREESPFIHLRFSLRKFLPFSQTLLLLRHRRSTCEPQFLSFRDSRTSSSLGRAFPSLLVSSTKRSTRARAVFRLFQPPHLPSSLSLSLFRPFRSFSSLPRRPRG